MGSVEDWVMRTFLKIVAFLPVYTAIVTTLTLLAILWGIPFVSDGS